MYIVAPAEQSSREAEQPVRRSSEHSIQQCRIEGSDLEKLQETLDFYRKS